MTAAHAELSPVQRALLEQRKLRARLREAEGRLHAPIAVIGLGCRFPGASDPRAFWELLRDGSDAIRPLPEDRWDVRALHDPDPSAPGKIATRWGGFLEGVDLFDAGFFDITRREADGMDPQQRLLLEVAWEALEHAGHASRARGSSTGVFIGVASSDYAQLEARMASLEDVDAYTATGYSHSVVSGRLSYVFGLEGPAVSVDTACSSSLVAAHLACHALRAGECRMALAGGVNHVLAAENFVSLSRAGMMAPDGRCKTFDAAADGFVRSEGCGVVVLKRLSDARADGDRVLAVIRGSATNQDGRSGGLTVPNGLSQEAVIRSALESARIRPSEVSYVEAHGTGTSLGDPIEVQALGEALGDGRGRDDRLRVGSVKTNVGHLESAAGVCGLIKVVLSLWHRELPPSLNFSEPNPHIPWDDYPFVEVVRERTPWDGPARVAGVSSFGFSGSNAHLIVGDPPDDRAGAARGADGGGPPEAREDADPLPERPLHLLPLSARSDGALRDLAERYVAVLGAGGEGFSDASFADACHTAGAGRRHFEHRLAVVASSASGAAGLLAGHLEGRSSPYVATGYRDAGDPPRVAFLFTGQGAQCPGMGAELYRTQTTFRAALDRCAEILDGELDRPLLGLLYGGDADAALLAETAYTQPAMFAVQYALSELWRSWGVVPSAVMGHSLGEFAAARAAGVLSLEDGLRAVSERGRLMASLPPGGAMAAIFAEPNRVEAALASRPDVGVAAVNGPANVVISGPVASVESVIERFLDEGVESRVLRISNGFHSPLVQPILEPFEAHMAALELHEPRIPMVSNLTGAAVGSGEVTDPAYWRDHLRRPVLFRRGMESLSSEGIDFFVEIGPHGTLLGLGRECVDAGEDAWLPTLRRERGDWEQLLETASRLYLGGVEIDWRGFDRDRARALVDLPTYPFQRSPHWFTSRSPAGRETPGRGATPWESAVESARRRAGLAPVDLDLESYPERWRALDRLTTAHVVDALRSLGAFREEGELHGLDELCRSLGVAPVYRDLVGLWLRRLADEGLLEVEDDGFRAPRPLPAPDLAERWREAEARLAGLEPLRDYLRRCGERLPELITGRADPLDTLFPDGSFDTAEFFYRRWALPRYFNGIVAEAVASWLRNEERARTVRILEIGAGSGGTTAAVLEEMPRADVEYWFTDISDHFLDRAAREFGDRPFLRYARFDAEEHPASQDLPVEGFDVVIAANALHATRDVGAAIDHARALLRPGGLLALYEVTSELSWFPMSIALIEGWQRHADELRGDGTVLTAQRWEAALGSAGFAEVESLPEPGSKAEILGHHVVLARKDGTPVRDGATGNGRAAPGAERHHAHAAADREEGGGEGAARGFADRLRAAPPSDRDALAVELVREQVKSVLRLEPDESPDRRDRLMDLGVDSLMAVELKGRLGRALGGEVDLPSTLVFDYPTIEAIAGLIRSRIEGRDVAEPRDAGPDPDAEAGIAELSDEEVEALLVKKLEDL